MTSSTLDIKLSKHCIIVSELIFKICKMDASKVNDVVVETVDFRSPAGENKEPVKEKVEIVHHEMNEGANCEKTGAAGFVAKAGTAVTDAFQSAKNAVSGKPKEEPSVATKAGIAVEHTVQSAQDAVSGKPKDEPSVITKAGAAVADTFESAKDAISGKPK